MVDLRMRQMLLKIHLWIGLIAGSLLLLIALSGSLLVFRADIYSLLHPAQFKIEPLAKKRPVDDWVAAAQVATPDKILARITLPETATDIAVVHMQVPGARNLKDAKLESVHIDPYHARVLGTRNPDDDPMWRVQDFHYAFFLGYIGLKFNGLIAITLTLLALSGPVLWWPGWSRLGTGFRVRAEPARAKWRDLHALTGFFAAAALTLIGLTGTYYAYRDTTTAVVTLVSGNAALIPPRVAPSDVGTALPLQTLIDRARRQLPEVVFDEYRPARGPGAAVSISYREPGQWVFGRNRIFLNPATGTLLRTDRYEEFGIGAKLLANMQPWHFGNFGGRITQWLWVTFGLVPAFLFGSGLWMWWRKRIRS